MSKRANKKKQRNQQNALETKFNFELKHFTPLTLNQETVFKSFPKKHLFLHGLAGTGKSFIAIYLSLKEIFLNQSPYKKLVIVRSLVQTRDMGHLPGSDRDKMKVYEMPYMPICSELFGRGDAYCVLKQKGLIEFMSTSFIRGITINDAIVLVDECQNLTAHEMHSIMTRIGHNCKIIFAGDLKQTDLNKRKELSGVSDFIKIVQCMNCFQFIEFKEEDIVRSALVKNYIITKNRLEENGMIQVAIV
jgi:phosphate starvation-inducible protein PhoH